MSVQSAQTYLNFFAKGQHTDFLRDLVYSGVKFEVLNPYELSTKWADVDFLPVKTVDNTYTEKLDKVLQLYKPKGIFASFIDVRPAVKMEEIKKLQETNPRSELESITDSLYAYTLDVTILEKAEKLLNENAGKKLIFGKNLAIFKERLDVWGLKVIEQFKKNHNDQDIDENIPELDLVLLESTDQEVLLFEGDNLDYIFDFQKSISEDFQLVEGSEFIKKLKEKITENVANLDKKGYNPQNLSKEKYRILCVFHADLELESILEESEKLIFTLPSSDQKNQFPYAFIVVHPDHLAQYQSLAKKYDLVIEKTEWDGEIVVWNQSANLAPFKSVAESLGTISSKEVDPSSIIGFFFSLFFAFCLGDAIYGLFLALFCGYFLFFQNLKPQFQNIFRLFFISGVATVIFGALLNSWAGDLFVKVPGLSSTLESFQLINSLDPNADVPVNRLLLEAGISPIVALLGFSIMIGLINILVGYIINVINKYKEKNWAGFLEELNWVIFLSMLIVVTVLSAISSSLTNIFLIVLTISGLAFFILNGGKGLVSKILSGLGKIYGLISFGADILSFTRLVAVGLTGGIIANVINLLAFLIYDSISVPILNLVALAVILVFGHAFNLVISLFGAYINPLRLHYVEFLPKFYDPKGKKLSSLKTEFKYLKVN